MLPFTIDSPLEDIICQLPLFNAGLEDIETLIFVGKKLEEEMFEAHAAYYCFNQAGILLKHKELYSNALLCFNATLKIHRANIDALVYKAEILCKYERYDEALQCCEIALAINPHTYAEDLQCQGIELVTDPYPLARQLMKTIRKHFDDVAKIAYAKSLHGTARMLHRTGKLRESIKCYDDMLAIEPGNKIALLERMRTLEELVVKLDEHHLECVATNAY